MIDSTYARIVTSRAGVTIGDSLLPLCNREQTMTNPSTYSGGHTDPGSTGSTPEAHTDEMDNSVRVGVIRRDRIRRVHRRRGDGSATDRTAIRRVGVRRHGRDNRWSAEGHARAHHVGERPGHLFIPQRQANDTQVSIFRTSRVCIPSSSATTPVAPTSPAHRASSRRSNRTSAQHQ